MASGNQAGNFIADDIKEDVEDLKDHNKKAISMDDDGNNTFKNVPAMPKKNSLFRMTTGIGERPFAGAHNVAGRQKRDPTTLNLEQLPVRKLTAVPEVSEETKRLTKLVPTIRTKDTTEVTSDNKITRFDLADVAIQYNKSHIRGYKSVLMDAPKSMVYSEQAMMVKKGPTIETEEAKESEPVKDDPELEINPRTTQAEAQKFKDGYHGKSTEEGSQTTLERGPDVFIPTVTKAKGYGASGYSRGGYRGMRKTVE